LGKNSTVVSTSASSTFYLHDVFARGGAKWLSKQKLFSSSGAPIVTARTLIG